MARIYKPFVHGGGYYPSAKYTPLVYPGGYTTLNAKNGKPEPLNTFVGKIVRFLAKRSLPMVKLEANFTPIQDLHGQEAPWPPGGGKNLLPMTVENIKAINTVGTWSGNAYTLYGVTYTLNTDDGGNIVGITVNGTATQYGLLRLVNTWTNAAETILNGTASGSSGSGYRIQAEGDSTKQDTGSGALLPAGYNATRVIIVVPSGVSASNAVFKPMIRLSSVSDTTFAPYSNICPISGHTGAEINRTGKNLFDPAQLLTATGWSVDSNGVYSGTRGNFHVAFGNGFPELPPFKENTQYTLTVTARISEDSSYARLEIQQSDGTVQLINITSSTTQTYTVTSSPGKTIKNIIGTYGSVPSVMLYLSEIQLEESVTASDYEPYSGTTKDIDFGTTVYGGQLTVFEDGSGQIVADRAKDLISISQIYVRSDNPSCDFGIFQASNGFGTPLNYIGSATTKSINGWTTTNNIGEVLSYSADVKLLAVSVPKGATLAEAQALFDGTDAVYKLATPVTIPLTPGQIQTLVGENNVWVNAATGDITVQAYGTEIV